MDDKPGADVIFLSAILAALGYIAHVITKGFKAISKIVRKLDSIPDPEKKEKDV